MLEVRDELAEYPCLVRVFHAAVIFHEHCLGQQRHPRDVMQRHAPQFPAINVNGVVARCRHDLVGDGDHGIEVVVPGRIEIVFDLGPVELISSGLDLEQGGPGAAPATNADESVRAHDFPAGQFQWDFDIRLDRACWCAKASAQDRSAELLHGTEHAEQGGCRPGLLFGGAANPRRGYQTRR